MKQNIQIVILGSTPRITKYTNVKVKLKRTVPGVQLRFKIDTSVRNH